MNFYFTPLLSVVGMVIASPAVVWGQSDCFCLQHKDTLQIVRWGCAAIRKPNGVTDIVRCQTGDFFDRELISKPDGFNRVPDGDGLCVPCTAKPSEGGQDAIRNPETTPVHENVEATREASESDTPESAQ